MLWFWLLATPAVLLALLSLRGERRRAAYVETRLAEEHTFLPPATVIVPVKGMDHGLRENLAALANLDYPDYELLIVAHSASDIPPGVLPDRATIVLAHGDDPDTGEKVQNLQAAVGAARQISRVFAFADSDSRVPKRWLRALVAPLAEPGVGASTGYRWYVPEGGGFWPLMRSVWDAVGGSRLGAGDNGFVWGGAMAVTRPVFYDAKISACWRNTVSDDYALSAAVRRAGLSIAYAPGALAPSYEPVTAAEFFEWIRRQMIITRVYNHRLWRLGLVAHVLYCVGMLSAAVAMAAGYWPGAALLAAQLVPGMVKGWRRAALARKALPGCEAWFQQRQWAHAALVPLGTWMWLWALLASSGTDDIAWRGRTYKLSRPESETQL